MRLTIFHKLFISLLLISMIMMAGMALLINNSFQSGLQNYLNQREVEKLEVIALQVSQYYSPEDGWQMLKDKPYLWENLLQQIIDRPARNERHPARHFLPKRLRMLHDRIYLLNEKHEFILHHSLSRQHKKRDPKFIEVPIRANSKTVGWIAVKQRKIITGALAESFFKQQLNNFYLIAAWAALFSFVVAAMLVRHFLKPLKNLHSGAKALQHGDFQQQIPVRGNDELAELSKTFNSLTTTLKLQKRCREQWIADISHELRTPVAVLLSEIEALEDGIRKPEPKYIKSLHQQVMNLSGLVDDLYQLSLSDAGVTIDTSQLVDLGNLLETACNQNETRFLEKNIQLQRNIKCAPQVMLHADQKSLTQLLLNLFENSYRYTDPGGVLRVSLQKTADNIELLIEDSAPCVPDSSLTKLFTRLYRVDKSRSRANGGSGLGLSICQNIVSAHGGKITAAHSSLGGLQIKVSLPIKGM